MHNVIQSNIFGFGANEFERYILAGALRGVEADEHVALLLSNAGLLSLAAASEYARRVRLGMHRNFAGALMNVVQAAGDHRLEKAIPDLTDMHHAVEERVMTAADFARAIALHGKKREILDTYDTIKLRAGLSDTPEGMRIYRDAEESLAGLTESMHRDLAAKRVLLMRHMPDFLRDVGYDMAVRQITDRLRDGRYAEAFDISDDVGSREFFSALSVADDLYRNKALTEEEYITVVRKHSPYMMVHRVSDGQRRGCLENRFRAVRGMRADLVAGVLSAQQYETLCEGMRHVETSGIVGIPSGSLERLRVKVVASLKERFNNYAV